MSHHQTDFHSNWQVQQFIAHFTVDHTHAQSFCGREMRRICREYAVWASKREWNPPFYANSFPAPAFQSPTTLRTLSVYLITQKSGLQSCRVWIIRTRSKWTQEEEEENILCENYQTTDWLSGRTTGGSESNNAEKKLPKSTGLEIQFQPKCVGVKMIKSNKNAKRSRHDFRSHKEKKNIEMCSKWIAAHNQWIDFRFYYKTSLYLFSPWRRKNMNAPH